MAKTIQVKGQLIKAQRMAKSFKGTAGKEKTHITIANAQISDEDMQTLKDAFKESGKKFTPAWVNEFEGYVNVSTVFALPCKSFVTGNTYEDIIDDLVQNGEPIYNANAVLTLTVKNGAVYPKSIALYSEGEPYDMWKEYTDENPFS